ncbi:hypothetical protein HAX54_047392 [Datura stramonium]|uniref:Uncharacterized protein n=1 Tax=Datura stramonium TaxID=4076 RepID=A0ABS8SSY0_DATST|nr:hypothetical protein [Datura stramonium]
MYRYGDALGGKDEARKLWMVDLGANELILNTRATGQTLDEGALEVLDAFMSEEKISEECVGQIQIILCNDCQKRGTASFPGTIISAHIVVHTIQGLYDINPECV